MAKQKIKTNDETDRRLAALAEKEETARLLEVEMTEERETVKASLRSDVEAYLENYGFTVGDLFGGRKSRGMKDIIYRDPSDYDNTWTGRGRRPHWLNSRLAAGELLTDFAVDTSVAAD